MWFWKQKKQDDRKATPEKELLKKVRRIHIRSRRMVNDVMAGEYQSAFKGRGMEFDMVREYQEGDEERMIDWNVTARFGHPYVKSYIEERELTVVFLVDISASGRFGSFQQLKKEVAAEFCGVLAFNAIKKNDRVGLILFSDQIELFVPPQKGKTHVLRVIRELLLFRAQHDKTSINAALEYFNRVNKRRAIVFLVSDFMDHDYFKNMNLTNKRHDLVAVEICDPREETLSGMGLLELQDLETGEHCLVDTDSQSWQRYYRSTRLKFNENKKDYFQKSGIDHLQIRTDRPFEHDLVSFFKKRSIR
ncbi:MAG: DUF58 domain-containing protein [Proteobacteria bacterium]|nr:DUF58 domain-containing protein [Pseudomonadota bacterium]